MGFDMLTPSKDDPNRRKELARKKKDPFSFGTGHKTKKDLPEDWKGNKGLVSDSKKV